MDKPIKEAFYVLQHSSFNVTIPKKRGEGYLKSCFGWHSTNDACSLFDDIKPIGAGDTCDIDGYLSIDISVRSHHPGYNKFIKNVVKALEECFPHVDKFTEDQKFWDIVQGNIDKPSASRKNKFSQKNK